MKLPIKKFLLLSFITLLAGCSINAPTYSPSYDNVKLLSKATQTAGIDTFKAAKPGVGKISLRASTFKSPYGDNFNSYLEHALQSELEQAKLFKSDSPLRMTAVVEENDVDVEIGTGRTAITAKFTISKGGLPLYDKRIQAQDEWDSSFVGAVAIPRGAASYPAIVKKWLSQLYSDPDFIAALSVH